MGALDSLFDGIAKIITILLIPIAVIVDYLTDDEGNLDIGGTLDEVRADGEEAVSGIFETAEQDMIDKLAQGGTMKPEGINTRVDRAEKSALGTAIDGMGAALGIEISGVTQVETHQFVVSQLLAAIGLDEVLGREIGMFYSKGVDPALEADVAKRTRSEFVSVQDAHEYALRKRTADEGYLHASGAPDVVVDAIGSNEPVNEENILEEWGIRDDQLGILEEVGIEAIEAEELLESPVQFGVVPDPELVRENARRAGLPQEAIDLFGETAEAATRSSDMWEQRTAIEPVVSELDTLVADGEITPGEAMNYLPPGADEARDALADRWRNIQTLPNEAPTRGQLESWFTWGLIDRQTFVTGLQRVDVDPNDYPAVVAEAILGELDGDLRTALGIGLLDENRYSQYARTVGLDQSAIQALLTGSDLKDIGQQRASEEVPLAERPTDVVIDVGENRAAALEGVGIETVGDLATASVDEVSGATDLVERSARTLIERAKQMTN
jgi:hypothetical protein